MPTTAIKVSDAFGAGAAVVGPERTSAAGAESLRRRADTTGTAEPKVA